MRTQLTTFMDLLSVLAIDDPLTTAAKEDLLRLKSIRERASSADIEELIKYLTSEHNELIRAFSLACIMPVHNTPELIKKLAEILLAKGMIETESVRLNAVKALGRLTSSDALHTLIQALIFEQDPFIKAQLSYSINIHRAANWRSKLNLALSQTEKAHLFRENLDIHAILQAVKPAEHEQSDKRFVVSDFLLETANYVEPRMVSIIAGILLEECNQKQKFALQLIRLAKEKSSEKNDFLEKIEKEVTFSMSGNQKDPKLEIRFHQPLKIAHEDLRENWKVTHEKLFQNLKIRNTLLIGSSLFSSIVLGISLALIFISGRITDALIGMGVALIVLITTFIFSGSIEKTKQVHTDIGAANTALLAFVQRSLELSNGFNYLYDEGLLDVKSVQESENLIGKAMKLSVHEIRSRKQDSLMDLLEDID